MNKQSVFLNLSVFLLLIASCKRDPMIYCNYEKKNDSIPVLTNICFGSCASQNQPQPILYKVIAKKPDLFIYLGDNVYGDTKDMDKLKAQYGLLSCKDEFQKLQKSTNVLATWDDHDFGVNDGGVEYPMKEESKQVFLDFWKEKSTSDRYLHKGIYHSEYFGDSSHLVQIILLDLRTFRTPLIKDSKGNYIENYDVNATMLGTEQWEWLQAELTKKAKLRIVCSSTQFGCEHNGWEAWANFPLEQQKFFQLIKDTRAEGLFFISGDVHEADLSERQEVGLYPIYDLTSSGITELENGNVHNKYRIQAQLQEFNFGQIKIDWQKADPEISLIACDINGVERIKKVIPISLLKF